MCSLAEGAALPSGSVIRDQAGAVWEKYGPYGFRRVGSAGFYDYTAIVSPFEVLWQPVA